MERWSYAIAGARLGHCLFYDPGYYLGNPHKMLMVWEGGLASHGGAIGILAALFAYTRRHPDQPYLWLLDRMVMVVALAGLLIRLGNFFNSEILGIPTDVPWAVTLKNDRRRMAPTLPSVSARSSAYRCSSSGSYSWQGRCATVSPSPIRSNRRPWRRGPAACVFHRGWVKREFRALLCPW